MNMCHKVRFPQNVDIAFIEYAKNDFEGRGSTLSHPLRRPYERLIRKLLGYQNHPAVILYHVYVPPYVRPFQPDDLSDKVEEQHNLSAHHYKLQSVSVKEAVWRKAEDNTTGFVTHDSKGALTARYCRTLLDDPSWKLKGAWLQGKVFFQDLGYHADPHTGLRLMGELAAEVLLRSLLSLNSTPYSAQDEISFNASLTIPSPLASGNLEAHTEKCIIEEKLNEMAVKGGFVFTDEDGGWGKWGLVSYQPGSFVKVTFDSTLPSKEFVNEKAAVRIAYLKSWSDVMGKMAIECVSGCSCNRTVVDTSTKKDEPQFSTMWLHSIHVSQSQECKMIITVMNEISTKGHKVKIVGVMSSEDPSSHQWGREGDQLPHEHLTVFAGRFLS